MPCLHPIAVAVFSGRTSSSCLCAIGMASVAAPDAVHPPSARFEGHADVGTVLHPGAAAFDPATRTYTVSGSGENVWGAADAFHFAWTKVEGDVAIEADVAFVGAGQERPPQGDADDPAGARGRCRLRRCRRPRRWTDLDPVPRRQGRPDAGSAIERRRRRRGCGSSARATTPASTSPRPASRCASRAAPPASRSAGRSTSASASARTTRTRS